MDSFIAFDLKARKYFNIMVYTLTLLMDLVNMIDDFATFDFKAHKYFNMMVYTHFTRGLYRRHDHYYLYLMGPQSIF